VGRMMQLLEQHATRQPERPSSRRKSGGPIAAELDEVVLRCLAKNASERFQTGRDLFMALERLQSGEPRSPSGRRTSYSLGIPATPQMSGQPSPRDTIGATQIGMPVITAAALNETQPLISSEVAARAAHETVRTLAQTIADLHATDARLFVTLQRLKQLDDDLAHNGAQQSSLEGLSDDFEESSRAREASLRFSLGELCYERSQSLARGETPEELLEREIQRVELRVAQVGNDLEAELTPLVDHAISLAAARATFEENAVALHATLEALVDELLPQFASQPQVAPLANRLRSIRASLPTKTNR